MTIDLRQCTGFLRSCVSRRWISQGQQLHQILLKSGHTSSLFVSNCLLHMYTRCNPDLRDALLLFDGMHERNCFSWNTLLEANLKSGYLNNALQLFDSMPQRNTFAWNAVITALVRSGDLENSRHLLEKMPEKDAVACNAVIHGHIRRRQINDAFFLFKQIGSQCNGPSSPCNDGFVLATVLSACADQMVCEVGKQIHARVIVCCVELDSVLGSALVDMYSKCGDVDSAYRVLHELPEVDEFSLSALISGYAGCGRLIEGRCVFDRREKPSVVLWNSLINGYFSNDRGEEALDLFVRMRRTGVVPDSSTYATVLSACAFFGKLQYGKQMHSCGLKHGILADVIVASALIDCYSKSGLWEYACKVFSELKVHDTVVLNSMINVYSNCGRIEEARRVFGMIPSKSLISWNSMIVGLSQNGCAIEALELFSKMHSLGLWIDKVALASAISACASICSIAFGEQIFALASILGLQSDHIISSSLIDLYCKSGNVVDARRLFDDTKKSDEVSWNSMLVGYASNGHGSEVLELFHAMRNAGMKPNEVTFIGVLSGCCHSGLVEEGLKWFHRMKQDYGINPTVEHYSCIGDLLVRAGRLEEAIDFIDKMPYKADVSLWTCVLGGCKAHGNEALASRVVERIVELDPKQSGPYVQLSSVFAARGEWEKSAIVRGMMQERRVTKNPGYSWIDS
ncbi:putative pentatricopeptide repeat-containing protein At1g77010, mitochondrial [Typha angustifolia]|uniref:putative pentatricopeptide repeat-containing protein At1g77010, mitochondrial n=1 Tax=Typha angustifolia TaxID=59011 RepID=UPI003C2E6017